eukprot:GSChrysophyteH2.ASY1.ANO1.1189.1 assembled CDS
MKFLILLCCIIAVVQSSTEYNFRRDFYLDDKEYDESFAKDPTEGGRIQFVSQAQANLDAKKPYTVDFGGFSLKLSSKTWNGKDSPVSGLDWVRCEYDDATGTILTTMHAHKDSTLDKIEKLTVTDSSGQTLLDEDVSLKTKSADVQVTYATTMKDYSKMVIHLHNYGDSDATVSDVKIMGTVDGLSGEVKLKSGAHYVSVVDVSSLNFKEASVWTAVVNSEAGTAGFGGKFLKEFFPLESWPKGDDKPFPVDGCSSKNFDTLYDDLSLDTKDGDRPWYVLPSHKYWQDTDRMPKESTAPGIAGAFLGDESDGNYDDSWDVWTRQMEAEENMDELYGEDGVHFPTYDGGHINHYNGAFSGISDIQGMDFYVAACAPHITGFDNTMRIQGAYDYLYNTRQNMKPLPTWLYSQGYCADCWSKYPMHGNEVVMQMASVLAAGGKGSMLFQSDVTVKDKGGDWSSSWSDGSDFMKTLNFVREYARISDVDGTKVDTDGDTKNKVILSALTGPETTIGVFISTNADSYNDVTCYAGVGRHWEFKEQTIDKTSFDINTHLKDLANSAGKSPSDFFEVVEIAAGKVRDDPDNVKLKIDDDKWYVENLTIKTSGDTHSSDGVVRVFMLRPKSSSASQPALAGDASFKVIQTAENNDDRLTEKEAVSLVDNVDADADYELEVDMDKTYQTIRGWGGAFTDSTAYNFMQLPESEQEEFLNAYFSKDGLGYSICRLQMGSSDFAISHYNYANVTDDYNLDHFSIEHDLAYIIPMILKAQKVAAENGVKLELLATPWSPPPWMKRTLSGREAARMSNSLMPGLRQEKEVFQAWALYFSKYLSAYKDAGVEISYVTVQNEPHVAKQFIVTYECCGFDPEHERDFLRDYLGPRLEADHPDVKIFIHDDQKTDKMVEMVKAVMEDPVAKKYAYGAAFHWYDNWGMNYDILKQVKDMYPDLPILGTEATNAKPSMEKLEGRLWSNGQRYAVDILRDMNHYAEGWIDWNMLLDKTGGPSSQHLTPAKQGQDLGNCDAPIRANFTTYPYYPLDQPHGDYALMYQSTYYHYGSVRIDLSQNPPASPASTDKKDRGMPTSVESTAFVVPTSEGGRQLVVVVHNFLKTKTSYKIKVPNYGEAIIKMPKESIQTLVLDLN